MNQSRMVHKRRPRGRRPVARPVLRDPRGKHSSPDCARTGCPRAAGRGDGQSARRRRHGSVHCPLPQELTGALDDAQLRTLEERLTYLRELEERRTAILDSVREQGKLDAALEAAIMAADSKGRLEDIYLPFKPKRRTKAEIAREAGLEPLAELLLTQPQNDPQALAVPFINLNKQVADGGAALDGARAILVERFA